LNLKPSHSLCLRVASALILMPLVLYLMIYGGKPFLFMIGVALGLSIKEWFGMAKLAANPYLNGLVGFIYIFVCILCFVYLHQHYENGKGLTLALMLSVWASDSGAYFAGKSIGGPKMAPAISPNKTWAGLIGGIVSSVAALFVYAHYVGPFLGDAIWSDLNTPEGFTTMVILVIGIVITLSGQAGDLLISYQKRKVGVKDTGTLIPGHGGLLDRIDSLLLASPVFLICLKVFGI